MNRKCYDQRVLVRGKPYSAVDSACWSSLHVLAFYSGDPGGVVVSALSAKIKFARSDSACSKIVLAQCVKQVLSLNWSVEPIVTAGVLNREQVSHNSKQVTGSN